MCWPLEPGEACSPGAIGRRPRFCPSTATIELVHTDDPPSEVMVECDSAGGVRLALYPQTWTDEQRMASAGVFVVEPEVLARTPDDRPFDWEAHLFPLLVADGDPIFAQLLDGTVADVLPASKVTSARWQASATRRQIAVYAEG